MIYAIVVISGAACGIVLPQNPKAVVGILVLGIALLVIAATIATIIELRPLLDVLALVDEPVRDPLGLIQVVAGAYICLLGSAIAAIRLPLHEKSNKDEVKD